MQLEIRPEASSDCPAIRLVNDNAFGQDAESRLVDALREGGFAQLSLVAELDGKVVGHILFSDLVIETADEDVKALALAPLAVLPEFQNRSIGTQLTEEGLKRCREGGHRIVIVLGHPAYYPRFGFSPELALPLESPYAGPSFMALELVPGALDGVQGRVIYAPPFTAF